MEPAGLSFSADADKATLIRRAYLDLIGLPPTIAQVKQFVDDQSEDAWERAIEGLLESPHYGERWGRHWLDVAGYADSEGYSNRDDVRTWAYKYRDWVIRAFNDDMPFDQFIRWQLAGDELVEPPFKNMNRRQIDKLLATGFLRMAVDGTGSADNQTSRNRVMEDTIKIVSTSLLGMSYGCAQCHDHRYDPISQEDYYRLRAVLEPALDYKKWRNPATRRVSLYTDEDIANANAVEQEAAAKTAEKSKQQAEYMEAALQAELAKKEEPLRKPLEDAYKTPGGKRTDEQKALLKKHPNIASLSPGVLYQYNKGNADKLKEFDKQIGGIRAKKPKEEFIRALTEPDAKDGVSVTKFFYRGDANQPQHDVQPGGLTVAAPPESPVAIAGNDPSRPTTGRRLAYANWLTSGRHPLVARVLVNRFWLNHFGKTFVSTPGEFGKLGALPSHPELLDWLADEFMAKGWSLKHLHRLVMTSTVYRQQSVRSEKFDELDRANNLYWHFPVRRLEAEVIRDSMLAVSGRLQLDQFGAAVGVQADDTGQIIVAGDQQRRSIYLQVRRTQPIALLKSFDAPVMEVNCTSRQSSTVATQSLMLMNSGFVLKFAKAFAARVNDEAAGRAPAKLVAGLQIERGGESVQEPWSYGYGSLADAQEGAVAAVDFTAYPFFGGGTYKGGEKVPDAKIGFSFLNATGGHPNTKDNRPIRRWTSPVAGVVTIKGSFGHGSENGDGVRLTIHSSRLGPQGVWEAKHSRPNYTVTFEVRPGDRIDSIVDERENHTSDSFNNQFTIELLGDQQKVVKSWNSQKDFHGPGDDKAGVKSPLTDQIVYAWQLAYGRQPSREEVELAAQFLREQLALLKGNETPALQAMTNLCQTLLGSNEFLYVD